MPGSLEKVFAKKKRDENAGVKSSPKLDLKALPPALAGLLAGAFIGLVISGVASFFLYDTLVVQARERQLNALSFEKASSAS